MLPWRKKASALSTCQGFADCNVTYPEPFITLGDGITVVPYKTWMGEPDISQPEEKCFASKSNGDLHDAPCHGFSAFFRGLCQFNCQGWIRVAVLRDMMIIWPGCRDVYSGRARQCLVGFWHVCERFFRSKRQVWMKLINFSLFTYYDCMHLFRSRQLLSVKSTRC